VSSAAFQRRVSLLHRHCCMCRGCVYEQSGLPSSWGSHGTQQVVCLHVAARTAFTFPARRECVETARMSTSAKDRYSIYGSWDEWQGPTQKLENWQSYRGRAHSGSARCFRPRSSTCSAHDSKLRGMVMSAWTQSHFYILHASCTQLAGALANTPLVWAVSQAP
jgi:hypothetical protein